MFFAVQPLLEYPALPRFARNSFLHQQIQRVNYLFIYFNTGWKETSGAREAEEVPTWAPMLTLPMRIYPLKAGWSLETRRLRRPRWGVPGGGSHTLRPLVSRPSRSHCLRLSPASPSPRLELGGRPSGKPASPRERGPSNPPPPPPLCMTSFF